MKLLNFYIDDQTKDNNGQLEIRNVLPSIPDDIIANNKIISKVPEIPSKVLSFALSNRSTNRNKYSGPEYDLSEIGKIEDVDGFVRQAFKKKIGLMFKEGFSYSGPNKKTIRYVKNRMAQISRASNIPTIELLKRISLSLIRTSNAYLVKVRDRRASGGRPYRTFDGKALEPIAGYFPAAPETMRVELDSQSGQVLEWKQVLPDGRFRIFKKEDVVHFTIDRREGFFFGIPTIVPVVDDIRALRQLEENVELLLYQYLFPLFHYRVGTETAPAGFLEDGTKEIDIVKRQIELMPPEGVIVTPERHEINAVGAEGRAVRAEGYLEHFKKRVFAGLGVSQVDMGESDTSNRATALTLSRQLVDSVKEIQDTLEAQWDHWVISELLLEANFNEDVLEEDNMVHLKFHEIDINNKMEQQKHSLDMFKGNALTYNELRSEIGREPILVPDDPQNQDPSQWPEWFNTFWKLFEEPLNMIRAVDEPYGMAAQVASEMRSLSLQQKQIQAQKQENIKQEQLKIEQDRKTKILLANKKSSIQKDSFLNKSFDDLQYDTINRLIYNLNITKSIGSEQLLSMARVWAADTITKLNSIAFAELLRGFNIQTSGSGSLAESYISVGRQSINDRIYYKIDKLVRDLIYVIIRRVDSMDESVKLSKDNNGLLNQIYAAFDSVRFRVDYMWDVEVRKAYNFGRVLGIRFSNDTGFVLKTDHDACEKCKALNGKFVMAGAATIEDVPPFHANSRMQIDVVRKIQDVFPRKDYVKQEDPNLEVESEKFEMCPICGGSSILEEENQMFFCPKCKKGFQKIEDDDSRKN